MAATKTNDQGLNLLEKDSPISEAASVEGSKTDSSPMDSGADAQGKGEVVSESTDQERGQDDPPAEPPSEEIQRVQTAGEDYSVLTVTQKKLIITTASLASLFSPMATAIYCQQTQHPTFCLRTPRTDFNRPITRYDIKGPECVQYKNQYHHHTLLSLFPSSFISMHRLTVSGHSRDSASLRS